MKNRCNRFKRLQQFFCFNSNIKRANKKSALIGHSRFLFLHCRNKADLFKHFVNLCAVLLCSDNIA